MSDTYSRFDAATGSFTAYALLRDGKPVARVVIKFSASATAFVQVWGAEMQTARANSGGYDKASAAVATAACKLTDTPSDPLQATALTVLRDAFKAWNGGDRWTTVAEQAGFTLALVI